MKKRFPEEQIIGFLKTAEVGLTVKELCRRKSISDASFDIWRSMMLRMPSASRPWKSKMSSRKKLYLNSCIVQNKTA